MVNSILGFSYFPYVGSYFVLPPLTYGGFSSFDYYPYYPPSLSWYLPSLWNYEADKLKAGAILTTWGRTTIDTDPWYFHYFGWPLILSWMYPQSYSYWNWLSPLWIPPLWIPPLVFNPLPPASAPSTRVEGVPMPTQGAQRRKTETQDLHEENPTDPSSRKTPPPSDGSQGYLSNRTVNKSRVKTTSPRYHKMIYLADQLRPLTLENLHPEWRSYVSDLLREGGGGSLMKANDPDAFLWISPDKEAFAFHKSDRGLILNRIGVLAQDGHIFAQ